MARHGEAYLGILFNPNNQQKIACTPVLEQECPLLRRRYYSSFLPRPHFPTLLVYFCCSFVLDRSLQFVSLVPLVFHNPVRVFSGLEIVAEFSSAFWIEMILHTAYCVSLKSRTATCRVTSRVSTSLRLPLNICSVELGAENSYRVTSNLKDSIIRNRCTASYFSSFLDHQICDGRVHNRHTHGFKNSY